MSLLIGLASALGGLGRGIVEKREDDRIREERARMQAASELKDRLAMQRQARLDQQAADQTQFMNRDRLAQQAREMASAGFTRFQPGMMDGNDRDTADAAAQFGGANPLMGAAAEATRVGGMARARGLADAQGGYLRTGMSDQERIRQDEREARKAAQDASLRQQADLTRERLAADREKAQEANALRRDLAGMAAAGRTAGAVRPTPLRAVPAGTVQDFQGLQANIRELAELEALAQANPKAFNEALGLKNMLPEWLATRGMSDDAITARGRLSNVSSGVFLERSGAAVTPSEAKRLEGWTANLTDNPTKARVAIRNMRKFFEQKAADTQAAYNEDAGYRPLGGTPAPAPDVRADSGTGRQSVPARRPGESIAQWRARTGGQ